MEHFPVPLPGPPRRPDILHCCSASKPNWKKRAFRGGNREELMDIQRELNTKIKEAKDGYQRKLERKLQQNNMREV